MEMHPMTDMKAGMENAENSKPMSDVDGRAESCRAVG
jgi:hypothetical protein